MDSTVRTFRNAEHSDETPAERIALIATFARGSAAVIMRARRLPPEARDSCLATLGALVSEDAIAVLLNRRCVGALRSVTARAGREFRSLVSETLASAGFERVEGEDGRKEWRLPDGPVDALLLAAAGEEALAAHDRRKLARAAERARVKALRAKVA